MQLLSIQCLILCKSVLIVYCAGITYIGGCVAVGGRGAFEVDCRLCLLTHVIIINQPIITIYCVYMHRWGAHDSQWTMVYCFVASRQSAMGMPCVIFA